jgi:hypothetical protein
VPPGRALYHLGRISHRPLQFNLSAFMTSSGRADFHGRESCQGLESEADESSIGVSKTTWIHNGKQRSPEHSRAIVR